MGPWSRIPVLLMSAGWTSCSVPLIVTEIFAPVTAGSRFFRPDGGKQVAELVLDLLGRRDRLRDFRPDQLPVAPPQAMDGHLERLHAHAELASELRVRRSRLANGEGPFQTLKNPLLA